MSFPARTFLGRLVTNKTVAEITKGRISSLSLVQLDVSLQLPDLFSVCLEPQRLEQICYQDSADACEGVASRWPCRPVQYRRRLWMLLELVAA